MTRPVLLYVVTEDWYFLSHRLPMARAARDGGFEVVVAARMGAAEAAIAAEGFRTIPLMMTRRGPGLLHELRTLVELARVYRRERPAIVHHIALKPALYGSVAAALAGVRTVVNSVTGMGYAFIGRSLKTRLLRMAITLAFRLLFGLPGRWLVVQNGDDQAFFHNLLPARRVVLIRGSGIDVAALVPAPEPSGPVRATLVARMLWDKGVAETVEAARLLKARGVPVTITLVGAPDPANGESIPESQLRQWVAEGVVEWAGHRADIAQVWAESAIALLPSYREGLPKSLLEAAACGRPMVATDVPGCRELVRHEINGLLVPARAAAPLADAIERLVADPALRRRLGAEARRDVEENYGDAVVGAATLGLYRTTLMGRIGPLGKENVG